MVEDMIKETQPVWHLQLRPPASRLSVDGISPGGRYNLGKWGQDKDIIKLIIIAVYSGDSQKLKQFSSLSLIQRPEIVYRQESIGRTNYRKQTTIRFKN